MFLLLLHAQTCEWLSFFAKYCDWKFADLCPFLVEVADYFLRQSIDFTSLRMRLYWSAHIFVEEDGCGEEWEQLEVLVALRQLNVIKC